MPVRRLRRGDLPPAIVSPPPGPEARRLAAALAAREAPRVNTTGGGEAPILWQEARGANVLDVDGNRYVDLTAGFGVAAVGHRHPRVAAAVQRQSLHLLHALGDVHAHPLRVELAGALCELAPVDDPRVYFAVSGADAVEIALKSALLATGRPGIVAFDPAYHGLTLGALAATSREAFRRPFLPQLNPRVHRLAYGCPAEEVAAVLEGGDFGCVLAEPMVGREGMILPPAGWLAALAETCRRHGALFVADEVFTGFGRTGRLFAVEAEGVRPDLLCCGKALAGGLPLAAVIGRGEVMAAWERAGDGEGGGEALHTATFLANPLACAAALATLEVLARERLVDRAAQLSGIVERGLAPWPRRHAAVVEVRGRGLAWGVEVASSRLARRWVARALRAGVLALAGGPEGRVLEISPPLVITPRQITTALELLEQALLRALDDGA